MSARNLGESRALMSKRRAISRPVVLLWHYLLPSSLLWFSSLFTGASLWSLLPTTTRVHPQRHHSPRSPPAPHPHLGWAPLYGEFSPGPVTRSAAQEQTLLHNPVGLPFSVPLCDAVFRLHCGNDPNWGCIFKICLLLLLIWLQISGIICSLNMDKEI